ncbi:Ribosome biogenesis protein BOP1-like protein [Hordeum vulgare]|nr:Ribosome biogenesis protein BOP1-like protein [Hordeum vulgare]
MGRGEEEDKTVLSPGVEDDTADLSADDSPWSDSALSEGEDDDEASLSFEDSGEGSDADSDSDGLEEEDDAAAEESDSSEDEVAPRNTVGDVPLNTWYKDEEHIGYDIEGRKIKKRDRDGRIERFLSSQDNKDDWYEAPTRLSAIYGVAYPTDYAPNENFRM